MEDVALTLQRLLGKLLASVLECQVPSHQDTTFMLGYSVGPRRFTDCSLRGRLMIYSFCFDFAVMDRPEEPLKTEAEAQTVNSSRATEGLP